MKIIKYNFLILLFSSISVCANPIDSTTASRYTGNESCWGFKLGRFHFSKEYFSKDGVSGTFLNDYRISKYFYLEASLQIYKTIGSDEGAISLNEYLSYPLTFYNQNSFKRE